MEIKGWYKGKDGTETGRRETAKPGKPKSRLSQSPLISSGSVFQRVEVCSSVWKRVPACGSVFQRVEV